LKESLILTHLVFNEEYGRKVVPFLMPEYFQDRMQRYLFETVVGHLERFNRFPSKETLHLALEYSKKLSDDEVKRGTSFVSGMEADPLTSIEWLLTETEEFCKDRAISNAIHDSIRIISGEDKEEKRTKNAIPEILSKALSVSFDTAIGHDFLEDAEKRFDYYHIQDERLAFDLNMMNTITKGGLFKKTLTVILASTGVGKTMFMTHAAAHHLFIGKNVLYITLEMSEEEISRRIDANLMGVTIDDVGTFSREEYLRRIGFIRSKCRGKLIVREYPAGAVSSAHFRHLIRELRIKKGFIPDVIYVDYLNLCSSSRIRMGGVVNSYLYVKSIAEEVRGLAQECNVPIITATQSNRDGFGNTDIDLDNTSESFGVPATADLMFALISTSELENLNQVMVKQLKNRYADKNKHLKFVIGIDRPKMKFYDLEQKAQAGITRDDKYGGNQAGVQVTELQKRDFGNLNF
jgi:Kyanoviridae DNA primase/helicase